MKMTFVAASLFFLALPVHAQTHIAGGGAAPSQLTFAGGGGGGGLEGSGAMVFTLPVVNRSTQHYTYIYVQGSDENFVSTRFVSFDAAVKLGKEALAYRPKTIVEVAAEYRAEKKQAK
ncbi:MAG: hypothetical protein WBD87_04075 [Candidatus Acidiferrales bacterium]